MLWRRGGASIGNLCSTELSGDSRVFAGAQIVIDRLFERDLQLSQGLPFIAHQGFDELEPAKEAVILGADFDRALDALVLQQVVHGSKASESALFDDVATYRGL